MNCLVLFLILFFAISGSHAAENPFIAGGVPASDREWIGKDYAATFQAFETGTAPLPVLEDPLGKRVIQRLTNEENFGLHKNKNLPLAQRLGDYLEMQKSLASIFKLYIAPAGEEKNLHAEQAVLMGFNLRVAALGVDLVNEFIPTIPKDDKYEIRMEGLKQMYGGLTTSFSGAESALGETKIFSENDFAVILGAMRSTLPTLKQAFTPEYQLELEKKLSDRKEHSKGESLAALEEMIKVLKKD
ncbi:hypothetical protein [Luteolibacter sp. Populi]|uniref:hypothetical protein n=1 Tax=Luteolibacter sp. Populi TaxID=3230487 RepID=UPI00346585F9